MDITRTLARRLADSRYEDIPQRVRHEASRALLNWLGCAIGSARHETVECALAAIRPCAGPAQATVLGTGERLDMLHASLINGISSHVLDFDDTHARAIHPSAPVLPALLALCEWKAMNGRQLVHAYVMGVEAEERIGLSVFPEHYDVGWHITGTAGVFGAAAASGIALGLDATQMAWALGIAATQSAGLRDMFGSMCKSLHPGRAAQNGLTAALLASRNFTSSTEGIEAKRGFAHVLSTRFDPSLISDGWGERFELLNNMYKPYACGLVVHAAIDGCIQLKRAHNIEAEEVAAAALKVSPLVLELTGIQAPRTGLEGKFSIYHAAAAALVHGAAGESQFSLSCITDPRVMAVRQRVTATADAAVKRTESHVSITLKDGRTCSTHVEHALGTLARPMSDADLEAKFRGLTEDVLPAAQVEEVIGLCWRVTELENAGAICRASVLRREP
jgi:2-methylcitrate dehydratase PrpD